MKPVRPPVAVVVADAVGLATADGLATPVGLATAVELATAVGLATADGLATPLGLAIVDATGGDEGFTEAPVVADDGVDEADPLVQAAATTTATTIHAPRTSLPIIALLSSPAVVAILASAARFWIDSVLVAALRAL